MNNKKTILLIGCNGYIGSRFVEQFHDKYNIAGIDTNFFGNDHEIVSKLKFFLKKDIREIEVNELPKIDYAVHMGELSNDPLGELDPNITKDINHNGTIKLYSLLKMTNVEKFVYMSSCSVYGFNKQIVNEDSKVNPLTEYAKAKIDNEDFLLNNDSNFQIKIFRNATAFGFSPNVRLDLVINELVYKAVKDKKIKLLSNGLQNRPFVHIDDINNLVVKSLEENEDKKLLVNVGQNNLNFSIIEIAEIIAKITNLKNIEINEKNPDSRSYFVDFSKLQKIFPEYRFQYNIPDGISNLIKNYDDFEINENSIRLTKIKKLIKNSYLSNDLKWN